jgi:hypothetical protein
VIWYSNSTNDAAGFAVVPSQARQALLLDRFSHTAHPALYRLASAVGSQPIVVAGRVARGRAVAVLVIRVILVGLEIVIGACELPTVVAGRVARAFTGRKRAHRRSCGGCVRSAVGIESSFGKAGRWLGSASG